ncbi:MAG: hypothetical protein IJL69_04410 [Oscillospiraceae bacterium]|nr:hypothetical protein [Oscillospiraceae bacterium]
MLKTARKRWIPLLLAAALLAGLFSACTGVPAETVTLPPSTTAATLPVETESGGRSQRTALSGELYADDGQVIFVDPTELRLRRIDRQTGAAETLFENTVYGEFIVSGELVWFCDAGTGRVCAGNVGTGRVEEFFRMPFSRGALIGDVLFFIDERNYTDEVTLYRYDTARGEWETRVLPGSGLSPNRRTLHFGQNEIVYLSGSDGLWSVYALNYQTWENRRTYTAGLSGRIYELLSYDSVIYFADTAGMAYTLRPSALEATALIPGAVVLMGRCAEGLLYKRGASYAATMYLGNANGQSADVSGGLVLATYGSRALMQRLRGGELYLAGVKYPEDTEYFSKACDLLKVLKNGRYALALLNASSDVMLFDLNSGTQETLKNRKLTHNGVSVEDYIAGTDRLSTPSSAALAEASPQQIAAAFAAALKRGDRYTLDRLCVPGKRLTPFSRFETKSARAAQSSDDGTTAVFQLEFECWSDGDAGLTAFLPRCIRQGRITVVQQDGAWRVDPDR